MPLSNIVLVDQSPVSKTPRSTPATYTGAWDEIRKLFANTELAKARGMGPGYFSYNSGDGRCPACSGLGYERIEMQFLSDVFVPCESCEGRRFKDEVLEVTYKDRSIVDLQEMEAADRPVFEQHPKLVRSLRTVDVGLGYLKLDKPSTPYPAASRNA